MIRICSHFGFDDLASARSSKASVRQKVLAQSFGATDAPGCASILFEGLIPQRGLYNTHNQKTPTASRLKVLLKAKRLHRQSSCQRRGLAIARIETRPTRHLTLHRAYRNTSREDRHCPSGLKKVTGFRSILRYFVGRWAGLAGIGLRCQACSWACIGFTQHSIDSIPASVVHSLQAALSVPCSNSPKPVRKVTAWNLLPKWRAGGHSSLHWALLCVSLYVSLGLSFSLSPTYIPSSRIGTMWDISQNAKGPGLAGNAKGPEPFFYEGWRFLDVQEVQGWRAPPGRGLTGDLCQLRGLPALCSTHLRALRPLVPRGSVTWRVGCSPCPLLRFPSFGPRV